MVSFHFPRPSTSSIQTCTSSFEDARSDTSSLDGISQLFSAARQDENRDQIAPLDDGNFGAIPSGPTGPPGLPTGSPGPTPVAPPPPPTPAQDDKFNTLLELLQQNLSGSGSSQRAKASVDVSTPLFRGDQSDKIDCGRWIETFEREARYYDLPRMDWPMAAAKRFPADSSAANWVDNMFGTGLRFEAVWTDFRRDFLEHFTPPDALPVARANFDNLRLSASGNITEFNKNFTDLATRLNCVLRDSGMPCLTFSSVCLAYQTKLHGPVRIHVDQYLSQRHIFNIERQRDGRPAFEVTPKELLAAAQQFASISRQEGAPSVSLPAHSRGTAVSHPGTTPMDLDTLIVERFNALHRDGKLGSNSATGAAGSRGVGGRWGGSSGGGRGGGGGVQCWECGGVGHVRSRCPTFLDRKEKDKSGKEAGKGSAQ